MEIRQNLLNCKIGIKAQLKAYRMNGFGDLTMGEWYFALVLLYMQIDNERRHK